MKMNDFTYRQYSKCHFTIISVAGYKRLKSLLLYCRLLMRAYTTWYDDDTAQRLVWRRYETKVHNKQSASGSDSPFWGRAHPSGSRLALVTTGDPSFD